MGRVNIYLPDHLAEELRRYRTVINVSEVCAAALRAELSARTTSRSAAGLFQSPFTEFSPLDHQLARRFRLHRVVIDSPRSDAPDPNETVSELASQFLDRMLFEGAQLGVGGGTQMWSVVRRLKPRNLRIALSAIGVGHVDHMAPHVHANVLVTVLSLLYAPRSTTTLVGASDFAAAWSLDAGHAKDIQRVIIGSCAPFSAGSRYAKLLGRETTELLVEEGALGDFLGVFLSPEGRSIEPYPPTSTVSHISGADLRAHAKRPDTIVALAAAGEGKVDLIRRVLAAEWCNTLITDEPTARALLRRSDPVRTNI